MKTALATLQEKMDYLKIEKMQNNDLNTVQVMDFSFEEYPATGFLHRVNYGAGEIYVFDMNYIDRLDKELSKVLNGGYGANGTIYQLKDVYGINEDFTVWYRDEDGNLYGTDKIKEIAINPEIRVNMSQGLMESMGLTSDTANIGTTRGKTDLQIDGNSMTTKITNLDDLSLMPNIKWLKLKDLNLNDLNGLQYLIQLENITFDNTTVTNLDGLQYATGVTGFYLINGSVTNTNMAAITAKFAVMPRLVTVRIRDNDGLTSVPALSSLGNVSELRIEENDNLTSIYGLSTVSDKSHLTTLYLNENNLADVVTTTQTHEDYGYVLPLLNVGDGAGNLVSTGNVINLSYLDGYSKLSFLNLELRAGSWQYYEDGSDDGYGPHLNQSNVHYLNGLDGDNKVGLYSCQNLEYLNLNGCDIYDVETLLTNTSLLTLNLLGSNSYKKEQILAINSMIASVTSLLVEGNYVAYTNTRVESLNLRSANLTDLSFLEGNTVTTSLDLRGNAFDNSQTGYIAAMVQLRSLNISACRNVTDFSFLRSLSELKVLEANSTSISDEDLAALPQKANLTNVQLEGCDNIDDVEWVRGFTSSTIFDFIWGGLSSTSDLSALNSLVGRTVGIAWFSGGKISTCQELLESLDFSTRDDSGYVLFLNRNSNLLRELEKCQTLTHICVLSNGANGITNNFPSINDSLDLSNLKLLERIHFRRTGLETLDVSGCTELKWFKVKDMEGGSHWDLPDFSKNSKLEYINLIENYLTQTDLVNFCNNVKPVYVTNPENGEEELSSGCPLLTSLVLDNNTFSSLSPLGDLKQLTSLSVNKIGIVSLSGVEDLTNLEELDISNNPGITNITPIKTLKAKEGNALTKITMTGCTGISAEMIQELRDLGLTIVK